VCVCVEIIEVLHGMVADVAELMYMECEAGSVVCGECLGESKYCLRWRECEGWKGLE
jgi:hypothetical protein